MASDVSVRPIREDDLAAWTPLWAGVRRVYWQTHTTNAAGRQLYDKVATHAGFILYAQDV
jgi:hypothetical protein